MLSYLLCRMRMRNCTRSILESGRERVVRERVRRERWRQLGEREEEVDRECPLSMVTLVCMYHVYSWFVYMCVYCFSMLFCCCLPGPTIRRQQKTSYYISCPRRMVYHLTLTVRSGHSWIYAPPHDNEVEKATCSSEL